MPETSLQVQRADGKRHTILITDRLSNSDRGLLIGVVQRQRLRKINTEAVRNQSAPARKSLPSIHHPQGASPVSNQLCELRVTVAGQQLDRVGGHGEGVSVVRLRR